MTNTSITGVRAASGRVAVTPLAASVDTVDTAVDAAKTATAAALTALQLTGIQSAIDTAVADGASPTEAHVDAITTAMVAANIDDLVTDLAAFNSAQDTLQADGATPTQAHVTAVSDAWDTFLSFVPGLAEVTAADGAADDLVTASQAAQGFVSGGVIVTIDLSAVDTVSKLRDIFNAIEAEAIGFGLLTP